MLHTPVLVGNIYWLSSSKMDDAGFYVDPDLDQGCFDHPVLVLSTDSKQAIATVLPVSQDK